MKIEKVFWNDNVAPYAIKIIVSERLEIEFSLDDEGMITIWDRDYNRDAVYIYSQDVSDMIEALIKIKNGDFNES